MRDIQAILTVLQKHNKNTVVDSEDGHYNVVPEADLTDNCGYTFLSS